MKHRQQAMQKGLPIEYDQSRSQDDQRSAQTITFHMISSLTTRFPTCDNDHQENAS
jgi:hypothetical protein